MERISQKHPDYHIFHEGDYSPVELAWCAYVDETQYAQILDRYAAIRMEIANKSFPEADRIVICYTKIRTDDPAFYRGLEQYEIYNGRISFDRFKQIVLNRFETWNGDRQVFECSLFQNIVEDMMLFRDMTEEEIIRFYEKIRLVLQNKDIHILYLQTEDIPSNIAVIRKERSDEEGNELWFPLMLKYFDESPYALHHGISGEEELYRHFEKRQELELRICRELFADRYTILPSKSYQKDDYTIE